MRRTADELELMFRAMSATPLTPAEIAAGTALWHATRVGIGVTGVATVLAFFDETRSPGLILAVPAAVLTGLAFALPLTAWSASRTSDQSFPAILRFGLIPMFLFGGAFYPVSQLPDWMEPLAVVTPLWHGIQLSRGLVDGGLDLLAGVGHVTVLAAFAAVGWVQCRILFQRRLHP